MRPTIEKEFDPSRGPSSDIAGSSYGRLIAQRYAGHSGKKEFWVFGCSCGEVVTRRKSHVLSGSTTSCGCHQRQRAEIAAVLMTTHGLKKRLPAEYRAWSKLKDRCLNPKYRAFADYGGRGIKVCDRWLFGDGWLSGFECFYVDMLDRPSPGHSIDRYPDNDGNYEPGNCRWATAKEQANNRRPRKKSA